MEETGGTIEDYTRLNADYTNVDEDTLLKEYYKKSKPHLNSEEIDFIMEDTSNMIQILTKSVTSKRKNSLKKKRLQKQKTF